MATPTPKINGTRLRAAGPIDSVTGYPLWYEDHGGTRLELGLGRPDPYLPAVDPIPHPGKPLEIPGNFPGEAFYFLAEAEMDVGGNGTTGRARLILGLEAAFGGAGEPDPTARVVFARIRIRMDDLVPGAAYVVTHPYGVTDELFADDRGRVFVTDDRGVADGLFEPVVRDGRVAPFLHWASGAPAGYLGDGVTERPVIGSPFGTNFFRVEGPRIAEGGGPRDPADPSSVNVVQTDLFTVQGRIATRSGVTLDRASYSRDPAGAITLAVHATSDPGRQLALDVPHVPLVGSLITYAAHAGLDAVPTHATVVNSDDSPATRSSAPVTDLVVVSDAAWDTASGDLTVSARSSDETGVGLSAEGVGPLTGPTTVFAGVTAPPATLVVTSTAGGRGAAPVRVTGPTAAALPPIARAGADQQVASTLQVTLDGSASIGATAWTWTQTSGSPVPLASDGATATFPAQAVETLGFTLTVTGPGGTATDDVTVTVTAPPPPDQLTVDRCQYRTGRRQFRVSGTCVGQLPNVVSATYTSTSRPAATIEIPLGAAPVDITNAWSIVHTVEGHPDLAPQPGDIVHVASDHGTTTNAALAFRN